jgi:hypothetical protein
MNIFQKWSSELAKVNNNIVNEFERQRTGKTGDERAQWYLEREEAMRRVADAMRSMGYSPDEIGNARGMILQQWNATQGPGWQKALEQNVREYGKEVGSAVIAVGGALQGIPGIGTVVGLVVAAAGTGLVYTSMKQEGDFLKKQENARGLDALMKNMKSRIGVDPVEFGKEIQTDYAKEFNLSDNHPIIQNIKGLQEKIRTINEDLCKLMGLTEDMQSEKTKNDTNLLFEKLSNFRKDLRTAIKSLSKIGKLPEVKNADEKIKVKDDTIKENTQILQNEIKPTGDEQSLNTSPTFGDEQKKISIFSRMKNFFFTFFKKGEK